MRINLARANRITRIGYKEPLLLYVGVPLRGNRVWVWRTRCVKFTRQRLAVKFFVSTSNQQEVNVLRSNDTYVGRQSAGSFSLKERDCEQSGYLLRFGNIEIGQSVPELTEVNRRRVCSESAVPDWKDVCIVWVCLNLIARVMSFVVTSRLAPQV